MMQLTNKSSRLGDRHLENILLDENTGDAIHVDFNCLFDKVRDPRFNRRRSFVIYSFPRAKH